MKLPRWDVTTAGTESAHADVQLTPPATPGADDRAATGSRRRPPGEGEDAGGAFACRTCSRRFPTFQALGGHRTGRTRLQARQQRPAPRKPRPHHECAVCGLEFAMGQALGGHMRRHKQAEAQAPQARVVQQEEALGRHKQADVQAPQARAEEDEALSGLMRRHKLAARAPVEEEEEEEEALGRLMRRNEQAEAQAPRMQHEQQQEALDLNCPPPLEDHRGDDDREDCSAASDPPLLNLLV